MAEEVISMASFDRLPQAADPQAFVGTWRRFGVVGPVYEIMGVDHKLADGDWMMRVRVLDTGEEVGYRLTDVMGDPKEA